MEKKHTNTLYAWVIGIVILVVVIPTLLLSNYYEDQQIAGLQEILSSDQIDIDSMSISGYRVTKQEPDAPIVGSFHHSNGQNYYISREGGHYQYPILVAMLSIVLASAGLIMLIGNFKKDQMERALEPVEKLANMIAQILSGNSIEADPEEVYSGILPYLDEKKLDNYQLEEGIRQLIEAETRRREFTTNVTHELKTPLTSINGYAEMISSNMTDKQDTIRFAKIILAEGNRLLRLINEILQLSKYDSGDRDIMICEEFDYLDLIKQVIDDMHAFAVSEEINLEYEGAPFIIYADRKMVMELVTNLVSNAIKYNYAGGNVYVSIAEDGTDAILKVVDDGIGISKHDRERIFERFYTVDNTGSRHSGTGLGLSLVKHIVKRHRGSVDLKSKPGQGTSFTVKIPLNFEKKKDADSKKGNNKEKKSKNLK
ncbi:MAG: HAMP domain-containing sensor histidine kinase [Tissierellia bacterium]|nr:HAMP domain-containing sensor histidine kinase [Tissierellia bacterium]